MTDKTFSQLAAAGALSGDEIFAIENNDGNSRKITANRARNFMNIPLVAHMADIEAHGISTFVATLLGADDVGAFLSALGITYSSNSDGYYVKVPFGSTTVLLQWGRQQSGGEGWSSAYNFPHAFTVLDSIAILATKSIVTATDLDGNDVSAVATTISTFTIGRDDVAPVPCNWIAVGI